MDNSIHPSGSLSSEERLYRFREAAKLFSLYLRIPILTDRRDSIPVSEFQRSVLFLEDAQDVYSSSSLEGMLEGCDLKQIRLLDDQLGIHALLILADDLAVLFGPFVTADYQEEYARRVLARFGWSDETILLQFKLFWCEMSICKYESVIQAARSMLEYCGYSAEGFSVRQDVSNEKQPASIKNKTVRPLHEWRLDTIQKVTDRYERERTLTTEIANGNEEAAVAALYGLLTGSRPQAGMTIDLWPQESAAAIMRSMIRLAAKNSPLSSVVIDGISLEYAQKMRYSYGDNRKTSRLYEQMIRDICRQITRLKEEGWSSMTQRAMHIIRTHYMDTLSVSEAAESLNVSESTLNRYLHKDTGTSFTQLLKMERMRRAAELLEHSTEPIQSVAENCGIPDQNYFVKLFRGIYGVTPTEYRRRKYSGSPASADDTER